MPGSQFVSGGRLVIKIFRNSGGKTSISWTLDKITGLIKFGSRSKEEARSTLRVLMELGRNAAIQAHHLIPYEHRFHKIVQKAAMHLKSPFHINDPSNGFALLTEVHRRGHTAYNSYIDGILKEITTRLEDAGKFNEMNSSRALIASC